MLEKYSYFLKDYKKSIILLDDEVESIITSEVINFFKNITRKEISYDICKELKNKIDNMNITMSEMYLTYRTDGLGYKGLAVQFFENNDAPTVRLTYSFDTELPEENKITFLSHHSFSISEEVYIEMINDM